MMHSLDGLFFIRLLSRLFFLVGGFWPLDAWEVDMIGSLYFFCILWSMIRYVPVMLLRASLSFVVSKCSSVTPRWFSWARTSFSSDVAVSLSKHGMRWYDWCAVGNSWPRNHIEFLIPSIVMRSAALGLRALRINDWHWLDTNDGIVNWPSRMHFLSLATVSARNGITPATMKYNMIPMAQISTGGPT